jgi:hypothetical protein
VRGDLAHVRLAGEVFVPHYAAPMPHVVVTGAELRAGIREDAASLGPLAAGVAFDVLDMAGGWAWGEVPDTGPVGYIPLAELAARA